MIVGNCFDFATQVKAKDAFFESSKWLLEVLGTNEMFIQFVTGLIKNGLNEPNFCHPTSISKDVGISFKPDHFWAEI